MPGMKGPCLLFVSMRECAEFCGGVACGCWRDLTPSTLVLEATAKDSCSPTWFGEKSRYWEGVADGHREGGSGN